MAELMKIDFYGDSLWAERPEPGADPIVAVKPIIERLGMDWSSQLQRIKRDEIYEEGVVMITIPSPGGPQQSVGLPLHLIPGFLAGIDRSRVPDPETRQLVLIYQRECHRVLYEYFYGSRQQADPIADQSLYELNTKLRMVENATKLNGKAAGRAMWRELGLPAVPELADPLARPKGIAAQGLDFVREFLAECTVEDADARVQARHLSEAYQRWAAARGAPSMTERALAMCLEALGIGKDRQRLHHYLGIRLKHISEQLLG